MTGPRTGLVLGAGGVLGSAWMVGALSALAARSERPLGDWDLLVGTSAGSVLAAALRCGMTVPELVEHQRGDGRPGGVPGMRILERESGDGLPPVPLPWIGSPRLLAAAFSPPWRVHPFVAASALLPLGRARLDSLTGLVHSLQDRLGVTVDGWVPGAPLWVTAVDYDSGRRVVFGREGAPQATVADAVIASCSIPGWFPPREIDGRRYVDGGIVSSTSLGLLAREELDEVTVLAPMASHTYDLPLDPLSNMERSMRWFMTYWLDREVAAVRAAGTRVRVLTPGPADLVAMGGNLMNPRRRMSVLETSLRTSAEALARGDAAEDAA